jgi:hypothetical protein
MTRPSAPLVLSTFALFVALGGTALAAHGLVTSRDIADRTIQVRDLSPAAVRALKGRPGKQGPPGPPGAKGAFDPTRLEWVWGELSPVQAGASAFPYAECPAGSYAIGGGYGVLFGEIRPIGEGLYETRRWVVSLYNQGSIAGSARAAALCFAP